MPSIASVGRKERTNCVCDSIRSLSRPTKQMCFADTRSCYRLLSTRTISLALVSLKIELTELADPLNDRVEWRSERTRWTVGEMTIESPRRNGFSWRVKYLRNVAGNGCRETISPLVHYLPRTLGNPVTRCIVPRRSDKSQRSP